ncbi:MAG TPA: glycosyltransferase 87 family protein [Friedmanniella sp.]
MPEVLAEPDPAAVQPARTDGFVAVMSERLGGPLGRNAQLVRDWWSPQRVILAVATLTYVVGMIFRIPCRITVAGQVPDAFRRLCYSDIGLLYADRGLLQGNVPYLDSGSYQVLEYPVLTGWFLELERRITGWLGAPSGTGLSAQQAVDATLTFVDVNQVLLGALFLVAVWAQVKTQVGRPWDAMMVAAAPVVAAASLVNWDLLAVALAATGMLAWSRRRPGLAGVLLGLGMAAKLYPVFLLGPLLLLCLRSARMRAYGVMIIGFVVSWLVVNLPVLVLAPDAWLDFWTFNADRTGDFGSIWYVFSLAGHDVPHLNAVSGGLFALGCVLIGLLVLLAPRRPRFGAVAFLVVAAFLVTNKVYSPQYVLWLLPFVVLARPRWRDWWVFTVGELCYFVAIWWHLGGELGPGDGGADRVYWFAVVLRLATEAWVVIMVVRDVLHPERDPVRASLDDPTGGVLDGAPDAPWHARLVARARANA